MGHRESIRQVHGTAWSITPPAGLLGLLAAPAIPRDTLAAEMAALPAPAVAPLLERLAYHRVDGLAFRAVSRLPRASVDPWLRATLKRRHQRCTAATLVQGMAVAEILHQLRSVEVRTSVLGGLRSVESIYGDAGLRPIDDHDLLVAPRDRDAAAAALRRIGFEAGRQSRFTRGGVAVELHVDAAAARPPSGRSFSPLSAEGVFERASSGLVTGAPAMLLSPEDELLLLAIRIVRGSFCRLIDIADLAHLVAAQGCALDWDAVRRRAASSHTWRLLALALRSTTLLGVAPPWDLRLRGSARWLEKRLSRRTRSLQPLPLGGEIPVALSVPGLISGLRSLVDVLLTTPRPGRGPRRRRSAVARSSVVPYRPAAIRPDSWEESVHGR